MMPFLMIPIILFNGGTPEEKAPCNNCKQEGIWNGIECPICHGSKTVTTPAEDPESKEVQLRISPQCIESFYPCFYEGSSMIVMMSGKEYMVPLSCEVIEQGIAGYWRQVNEKMGGPKPDPARILTLNPVN